MSNTNSKIRKFLTVVAAFFAFLLGLNFVQPASYFKAMVKFGNTSESTTDYHTNTIADSVTSDTPAITFLTHGLGGGAKDWSNNFNLNMTSNSLEFVEDSASIIEKMRSRNRNIKLYRAMIFDARDNHDFSEPIDSDVKFFSEYEKIYYSTEISEFSYHTIVVVDLGKNNTYRPMEEIYSAFHKIVDKVVYEYKVIEKKLPRINLIGHSMGGLLNMQYTIDHPKNVASLVSLGTPYNGSSYDTPLVENLNITDFRDQKCMTERCSHDYYFCHLKDRKSTWNAMYVNNPHIKFYPLAGQITPSFFDRLIYNDELKYANQAAGIGANIYKYVSYASPVFGPSWVALFAGINFLGGFLPGDVCVDASSQIATGYNGAIPFIKSFGIQEFEDYRENRSQFAPAVPHNLEVFNPDLQQIILNAIDFGQNSSQAVKNTSDDNTFGIQAELIALIDDKWIVKLTNNTRGDRCFEYNEETCTEEEAKSWTNLNHIVGTYSIPYGGSLLIAIKKTNSNAITISYNRAKIRYIYYAENLNAKTLCMDEATSYKYCYPYSVGNMDVSVVAKNSNAWVIKFTNNTGERRNFFYNADMCTYSETQMERALTNLKCTDYLNDGESKIIYISTRDNADYVFIFYLSPYSSSYYSRNVLRLSGLTTEGKKNTMNTPSFFSYLNQYYQSTSGIKVGMIAKSGDKWYLELNNATSADRRFEFNTKMCYESDALNWKNLSDVAETFTIANGKSTIIAVQNNGNADNIAISYLDGTYRKIFVANTLTMSLYSSMNSSSKNKYYSASEYYGMQFRLMGKVGDYWTVLLTNKTGEKRQFDYNAQLEYQSKVLSWNGLNEYDTETTTEIGNNESITLRIKENGRSSYNYDSSNDTYGIAISYCSSDENRRYVFYADNLNIAGTYRSFSKVLEYGYTTEFGLNVKIKEFKDKKWTLKLKNNTANAITIKYNSKMCFADDARDWKNLSDVCSLTVKAGKSTEITIKENGWATCIALSYVDSSENRRKVFYADSLDKTILTMSPHSNTIDYYGIKVSIDGKNGSTWRLKLENHTGIANTFYYNAKMCFFNDAKDWNLSSDVKSVSLRNNTSTIINITENWFATSIGISYIINYTRYIYYADNLNLFNKSMIAYSNTK